EDGEVIAGTPAGITYQDVPSELSEAAAARLALGGIVATADQTDEEVLGSQEAQGRADVRRQRDEIVEERTGKPAAEATPEEAARAIRNESLEQAGLGEVLKSRVIGVDPMDFDDDEVADRLSEYAARLEVGAYVDKAAEDVTAEDVA